MQPYNSFSNNNQTSASQPQANLEQEEPSSCLVGKRVVVVEDEGITQMHLRRILKMAGLTVLASATNGKEGVEVALRERPDLILMDIRMPGPFDGLEAARRILAEYPTCIVMLTAFSDEEYRKQAQEIRTCGYIVKPVTTETLVPQLEAAFTNFVTRCPQVE